TLSFKPALPEMYSTSGNVSAAASGSAQPTAPAARVHTALMGISFPLWVVRTGTRTTVAERGPGHRCGRNRERVADQGRPFPAPRAAIRPHLHPGQAHEEVPRHRRRRDDHLPAGGGIRGVAHRFLRLVDGQRARRVTARHVDEQPLRSGPGHRAEPAAPADGRLGLRSGPLHLRRHLLRSQRLLGRSRPGLHHPPAQAGAFAQSDAQGDGLTLERPGLDEGQRLAVRRQAAAPALRHVRRLLRWFVKAYQAEGIPVGFVTLQNEPHYKPPDYPGMRWGATEEADFVKNHLEPAFAANGITTKI